MIWAVSKYTFGPASISIKAFRNIVGLLGLYLCEVIAWNLYLIFCVSCLQAKTYNKNNPWSITIPRCLPKIKLFSPKLLVSPAQYRCNLLWHTDDRSQSVASPCTRATTIQPVLSFSIASIDLQMSFAETILQDIRKWIKRVHGRCPLWWFEARWERQMVWRRLSS